MTSWATKVSDEQQCQYNFVSFIYGRIFLLFTHCKTNIYTIKYLLSNVICSKKQKTAIFSKKMIEHVEQGAWYMGLPIVKDNHC